MQTIDDILLENPEPAVRRPHRYREIVKRCHDIGFSFISLIAIFPLMFLIALAISLQTRGRVFYAHERIGRHGKRFKCLKFRTMVVDADERLVALLATDPSAKSEFQTTSKLKNDPRVLGGLGSFLRKSSLDELPQFINVFLGDMSIVGPRPVTEKELDRYGAARGGYLSVRPGITGPWQVSGRNDVSFEQRIALDQSYTRNWSNRSDCRYIIATIGVVLFGKGAY